MILKKYKSFIMMMDAYTKVIMISKKNDMDMENINGLKELYILVIGRMIKQLDMVSLFMQMVIFMKGIGKMTKQTDMENIKRKMDNGIKDIGRMTCRTEWERNILY